jgi:hypothetical protein
MTAAIASLCQVGGGMYFCCPADGLQYVIPMMSLDITIGRLLSG